MKSESAVSNCVDAHQSSALRFNEVSSNCWGAHNRSLWLVQTLHRTVPKMSEAVELEAGLRSGRRTLTLAWHCPSLKSRPSPLPRREGWQKPSEGSFPGGMMAARRGSAGLSREASRSSSKAKPPITAVTFLCSCAKMRSPPF